jgi:hypothetical protein
MSSQTALRRIFFVVFLLAANFSGCLAFATQPDDGKDLPFNATRLPEGGEAYSFPAKPDELALPPDPSNRGLVASSLGRAAAALSVGAGDDRENTEPTIWAVYEHQTTSDVLNTAINNNYRVVDLFVESATQFTATYVANTQTYAKTWWFLVNATPADVLSFVSTNNARIVSMKTLDDPAGSVRFFVILISNTGSDAKTWYFYQGQTTAQLTALWQANNARMTQVTSHVKNGTTLYDAVMIANTGTDQRSWWWYVNATVADIETHRTTNNARIVDLDIDSTTGNYNVIMNSCSGGCPAWWWYVGVPTSSLISTVTGVGARIIDASSTPGCGDRCWSVVLIDNSHITISGNAGVAGATINYTGGSTSADSAGNYVFTVSSGWTGTVTPGRAGYRFTPTSRAYSGQGASANGQDFTATPVRGDFNGDGKSDIVWRNYGSGQNAIWYMDGLTVIGGGAFNPAPSDWAIVGVGDVNGDGKPDIVWRNTTSGSNAVWYMDGLNVIGGGAFNAAPTSWAIVGVGRLQRGRQAGHRVAEHDERIERGLVHGRAERDRRRCVQRGADVVVDRGSRRLQRGRQAGHRVAEYDERIERDLVHGRAERDRRRCVQLGTDVLVDPGAEVNRPEGSQAPRP